MNIKKINLILLSTALFTCHTSIFPMEKNQSLARIARVKTEFDYEAILCVEPYNSIINVDNPVKIKNVTRDSWVIVEQLQPEREDVWLLEIGLMEKEWLIKKKLEPNFKRKQIYPGIVRILRYDDQKKNILVTIKKGNISYPILCSLKKGININNLVPNKTSVNIKIQLPKMIPFPGGEIIKIIGTLPKLKKEQEKEAEIERGEFVAEKVLPQKEVETKKIKLEGKIIHVPPYLLKKGEK